jgi:hypothetical protein
MNMLSRQDIIDFCGLTEDEVRSIAKREGISDISAASMGQALKDVEPAKNDEDKILYEESEEEDLQQTLADFKAVHFCADSDVDE